MYIESQSVEETRLYGAKLAKLVNAGDVFALDGDLGTGKTEFVRGFVAHLGGSVIVRSPSFSILNIYQTPKINIYHFDFYRMADCEELNEIGFYEYIGGDGVCLIEWGTMFFDSLPSDTKIIRFEDKGLSTRSIQSDFDF